MKDIKEVIKQAESKLSEKFNYKNPHQVPKIEKIVLHRGLGEALTNSAVLEKTFELFYAISGQKPIFTKAKKSISNFKLREGQIVGCKVTLRSQKMYNFLNNLFYLSLPKIRDFRGISKKGCDKFGNFSFGIKDDSIFPESNTELDKLRGMDITICTTSSSKEELLYFLECLGLPFKG
ncbi:MAG: 50S ribosomal protein L5 [Candidatus Marinamargulisbacteria bacterium]